MIKKRKNLRKRKKKTQIYICITYTFEWKIKVKMWAHSIFINKIITITINSLLCMNTEYGCIWNLEFSYNFDFQPECNAHFQWKWILIQNRIFINKNNACQSSAKYSILFIHHSLINKYFDLESSIITIKIHKKNH